MSRCKTEGKVRRCKTEDKVRWYKTEDKVRWYTTEDKVSKCTYSRYNFENFLYLAKLKLFAKPLRLLIRGLSGFDP